MTNSPGGNAIEAYARASDGTLTSAGSYPTGGDGGALTQVTTVPVAAGSVGLGAN